MKFRTDPIRNWFGFTRRERRSSFLLLIIIIFIIALRYLMPEQNITIEDISYTIPVADDSSGIKSTGKSNAIKLFSFDPNVASYDTLIKLGFARSEAKTLINYRNKGGRFRESSDIKKVYGLEETKAEKLIPYVKVSLDTIKSSVIIKSAQERSLIDLNNCDSALLVTLPGIGPVLSVRILKYRNLLGGYASVEQLREVYGLPLETFDIIKERVFADSFSLRMIKVNLADYKELVRLPYLEQYEVNAILKYRELKGRVEGIGDLISNKLLSEAKAAKVEPYLNFE